MCLCFWWCFVPFGAHSIPTSTTACSRRLGCCPSVLPRPCVRAAAAFASRSGLASRRVLGEWRTHHCVVEIKNRAARRQRARPSVALFTTNKHSLECIRGAPNLLKLLAHHLVASYTHAHPSIYVTSTTVTHTRVCNTVSNTFPALT